MKHALSATAAVAAFWIVFCLWAQTRRGPAAASGGSAARAEPVSIAADSVEASAEVSPEPDPEAGSGPLEATDPAPSDAGSAPGAELRERVDQSDAELREAADQSDAAVQTDTAPAPEKGFDEAFRIPVLSEGRVISMALDEYLAGVLLGELPESFSPEARKAQAVACRTYALRGYAHRRHGAAAVCTDTACCQGWRDPAGASPAALEAAARAVSETDGLVILYAGELIDATFFSCSGGQTEAAAAVWGRDLPYLQPVDSPGEEAAAHFTDTVRVPLELFLQILTEADPEAVFPEALGAWVGEMTATPGGGVDRIVLGGRPFTGKQLRKRFGLRSTAFVLTLTETEAIFETRGSGHRVGMSQWGAEAMAREGYGFEAILTHYYQGVTVEAYPEP